MERRWVWVLSNNKIISILCWVIKKIEDDIETNNIDFNIIRQICFLYNKTLKYKSFILICAWNHFESAVRNSTGNRRKRPEVRKVNIIWICEAREDIQIEWKSKEEC